MGPETSVGEAPESLDTLTRATCWLLVSLPLPWNDMPITSDVVIEELASMIDVATEELASMTDVATEELASMTDVAIEELASMTDLSIDELASMVVPPEEDADVWVIFSSCSLCGAAGAAGAMTPLPLVRGGIGMSGDEFPSTRTSLLVSFEKTVISETRMAMDCGYAT